jgi:outer membrane receptor for ferrienterochelin and colicins
MDRMASRKHSRANVLARALVALAVVTAQVTTIHGGVARADGNADEADLHFQIAAEAYSKGDFRTALEHFLLSNRLVPNRNVVFNIARTYEQLKRFADAHRYYVDALEGETSQQTISTIQDAMKRIGPNVAVLRIESDPPGATVYIDRKDLGSRGRAPKPLAIAEGRYRVIVELEGYEPATLEGVEAKTGAETKVPFSLKRIVGAVVVSVEGAPGAAVHIDDETSPAVCTAPCTFDVPPGRHLLHFTRDGFQAPPRQINVAAKETVKTSAVLTPLTGSVVVQADERDAIVEIDGKPAGFTPAVIQSVPVGTRKVKVTLRGYAAVERDISVRPNQQSQLLDLKLVPLRQVAAASRFTENVEDAPSSVTIIDRQELRAFGYPTVYEALRGVRGVAVGYDRVYASAAIRGLGDPNDYGNRLLLLQDGTVLNDNILSQSLIGSDGRADLEDVDRIEIVRGPGSLVYGTGAMSGVVNLVPRPKDDESSVHVGGGTYDNSVAHGRAGFHVNFNKAKTAGMWASVSGARSDGVTLEVEPRDRVNGAVATANQVDFFRSYGTAGRLWAGPFTAQWFYHSRKQHLPTGPYFTLFNDARTFYQDERVMGEVRVEPKINDKLQLLARAHANHYHFHGSYFYEQSPAPGYDEDYYGTWFGGEAQGGDHACLLAAHHARRRGAGAPGGRHDRVRRIRGERQAVPADERGSGQHLSGRRAELLDGRGLRRPRLGTREVVPRVGRRARQLLVLHRASDRGARRAHLQAVGRRRAEADGRQRVPAAQHLRAVLLRRGDRADPGGGPERATRRRRPSWKGACCRRRSSRARWRSRSGSWRTGPL